MGKELNILNISLDKLGYRKKLINLKDQYQSSSEKAKNEFEWTRRSNFPFRIYFCRDPTNPKKTSNVDYKKPTTVYF